MYFDIASILFSNCGAFFYIDTERKPDFGPKKIKTNPTSLIQMCIRSLPVLSVSNDDNAVEWTLSQSNHTPPQQNMHSKTNIIEECVIVDLLVITKNKKLRKHLNNILKNIFRDDNILLIGQGIENDVLEMMYSYPHMDCFEVLNSALDTNKIYRLLYPQTKQDISLKNLVKQYLHCNLVKTQQLTNWSKRPLTENQLHYAACDAIVLIRIYDMMCVEYVNKRNRIAQSTIIEGMIGTHTSCSNPCDEGQDGSGVIDSYDEYDVAFRDIKRSKHSDSFDIMINGSDSESNCMDGDEMSNDVKLEMELESVPWRIAKLAKDNEGNVAINSSIVNNDIAEGTKAPISVQPWSNEHYQIFSAVCYNIDNSNKTNPDENIENNSHFLKLCGNEHHSTPKGKTKTEISMLIHEMINRPRDANSKHVHF